MINVLNTLDQLADENLLIVIAILSAFLLWSAVKRFITPGGASLRFPKLCAIIGIVLVPLVLISLSSIFRTIVQNPSLVEAVNFLSHLGIFVSIAWFIARLLELLLLKRSRSPDAKHLPGIERGLLIGSIVILSIFAFLSANEYSTTGLHVSTGVVAAVIAFAMQRTLGDFFSGIALSIEHPFRRGDWIELENGRKGQIIDINWRATHLRDWDNTTLIIPNGELARQGVRNYHGSDHHYSPWYEISLPAEVDPRFAKALLLEAALSCKRVRKQPLPLVRLANVSTQPYTYMVWIHFENYPSMFAGREELLREVHYSLKRAGIKPSSQIQQIHMRSVESTVAEPPTPLLALRGIDIGAELNEDELELLAAASEMKLFDAGTVLLEEGVVAIGFDIIISGVVECSVTNNEGIVKTLDQLVPGEYYAIASTLTNVPSFLSFTAVTDVTLIRINMDCLKSVLSQRPSLCESFAKIVESRMDRANGARHVSKKSGFPIDFHDILRRIKAALN